MSRRPGIDVSTYQGEINWKRVVAAGYRFASIRATLGNDRTDSRFYANWKGARDAGLLVSAYHVVKPYQPSDLPLRIVAALPSDCLRRLSWSKARRASTISSVSSGLR